jgi:hypothetical protein
VQADPIARSLSPSKETVHSARSVVVEAHASGLASSQITLDVVA